MRPSMGSVGDCYDNALCESFFATLECELLDRNSFRSHAEARMAIFDFIEGWYNPQRRHSSLDYLSPAPLRAAVSSLGLKPNYETVHESGGNSSQENSRSCSHLKVKILNVF